jgi:hypothetical protein
MINYAAILRRALFLSAAVFLLCFGAAVFHQAAQQRAEQLAHSAEAAKKPRPTNSVPMQGSWGCRAESDEGASADAVIMFSPAAGWNQ